MELMHGRVPLWLRPIAEGEGPTLLLLHGLGGSSEDWGEEVSGWPGRVFGLDFCGHGRSGLVLGGAYYAELLAGDADVALDRIGPAVVAGVGLGAYVAMLLAAARPEAVTSALLAPGAGLDGGGATPDHGVRPRSPSDSVDESATPGLSSVPRVDPRVSILEADIRPTDYAAELARAAGPLFLLEEGFTADGESMKPAWWRAVAESPTAHRIRGGLSEGLAHLVSNGSR